MVYVQPTRLPKGGRLPALTGATIRTSVTVVPLLAHCICAADRMRPVALVASCETDIVYVIETCVRVGAYMGTSAVV
jgi:hypothetical protein